MYKHISALAAILVIVIGSVSLNATTLTGEVTESGTGLPVPYASIQIEGANLGTMADSLGKFDLEHVSPGKRTVVISAVGFKTERIRITVSDDEPFELNVSLLSAPIDAGGIVVTATRTPRYVKDVPVFTEVISKASIEDKSAHNIFEALDGEAGIRVEQQCQGCNFSILRMQGLGADHTQVMLDGQPVYSGLTSVYGLQQMSTADVDQIEIVKGAGSALYGSNAVAGAINIISSVPRKTEGRIGIEFGEHGTNKYDFSASTRKGNWGVFLFAQQSEQDELDETGDINASNGIDEPDGWIDRVRATTKNAGANLYIDDVFTADRLILRGRLLTDTRLGGWLTANQFENPFAPGTERIITDRASGQIEYNVWFASGTEVNASFSFTSHKRDATNDTFLSDYEEAFDETPPVHLMRPYVADEELITVNVNLIQPVGDRNQILAGAQISQNSIDEGGMYLDIDTKLPYYSSSNKHSYDFGAYLQDEMRLTGKLEIVGGIRFDHHESEDEFRGSGDVLARGLKPLEYDESTFNPRLSVKYSLTEKLVLRGSAGSGFRVPYGFSEDLHLCSGSPRVFKGGELKPERSFSYSVNADYTTPSLSANVNIYRTELKDAIAFADADPEIENLGYTYQWENIDDANVTGIELNGSVSVTTGLLFGARCEIFNGEYDNPRSDWVETPYEDKSRNITRYPQISGGLKADLDFSGWELMADLDYTGKMYIDLAEPANESDIKIYETEPFVLLNAKIARDMYDRYELYIGAKNISGYTQKEKHIDDAAFMYAPVYGRIIYGGVAVSL